MPEQTSHRYVYIKVKRNDPVGAAYISADPWISGRVLPVVHETIITLSTTLADDKDYVNVGFAIQHPGDSFNKKLARKVADNRLRETPVTLPRKIGEHIERTFMENNWQTVDMGGKMAYTLTKIAAAWRNQRGQ